MNNKYKIECSDWLNYGNYKLRYTYYFDTLEKAKRAAYFIEKGGNIAKITKV